MGTTTVATSLVEEVAQMYRMGGISLPSACYAIFEKNNIPEQEQDNLCSQICSVLGSRGGKKSGIVRREKSRRKKDKEEYSPDRIKKIIKEVEYYLLLDDAYRHERQLLSGHPDP